MPRVSWRNTRDTYGWVAMILHWLTALMIFAMFGLGLWMRTLGYYDPWYHAAPALHKSAGMLLLLLLLLRWLWRVVNVRPALIGAPWERQLALSVHRLHYLLLFALMITGYLIPTAEGVGIEIFDWVTVPALMVLSKPVTEAVGLLHRDLAWAVMALATLHAAAALMHHFRRHDMTLRRMLGMPQD